MSVTKAMEAGKEKMGYDRTEWTSLRRQGKHRRVSFTGSMSEGTVRPEPGEAPATVSADCSGSACLGRDLGEGWSAGLVEDSQAAGNAPSQLAPRSLHTQRLGMLQTQQ